MPFIRLLILLLISTSGYCQIYNFEMLQSEKFNPTFIYDIEQGNNGVLYFATSTGLYTYDGITLKNINSETGLKDDFITELLIDKNNNIWLSYYQGSGSVITPSSVNKNAFYHFSQSIKINSFDLKKDSTVLINTSNGLYEYKNNKTFKKKSIQPNKQTLSFNNDIITLNEQGELKYFKNKREQQLIANQIIKFSVHKTEKILIAVSQNALLIYRYNTNLFELKHEIKFSEIGITSNITSMSLAPQKLHLGSDNNGIYELKFDTSYNSFSAKNLNTENGLPTNNIKSVFYDREEILWIGTYGSGIFALPKDRIVNINLSKVPEENDINKIIAFKNEIYYGTRGGLIKISKNNKLHYLKTSNIKELVVDKNRLWIGTQGDGLFYLEDENVQRFKLSIKSDEPKYINSIVLQENKIFVGTNNGLFITDFLTNEQTHITTNEGLAHNVIENFIIDSERRFWFDSPNSPIYNYKNGSYNYFKDVPNFKSYNITDIIEMSNKSIWFGTSGDGILIYQNEKFTNITQEDGLFSNYIYFISQTNDGTIYTGHKGSISILENIDTNKVFSNIGEIAELSYINTKAALINSNKNALIGTSTGAIQFQQIHQFKEFYAPELAITNVLVNSKVYNQNEDINLPFGNYLIDFHYAAISLSPYNNITYQYKLDGFDKDWNFSDKNELSARYQSVIDGKYTFRIKLIINGNASDKETTLNLFISPPIWKRTWFWVFIVILIFLTFIITILIINRQNNKLRKILAQKVEKRTLQIRTKNEEIIKINKDLEILSDQYLKAKNHAELKSVETEKSIKYANRIQKVHFRKSSYTKWISQFEDFFLLFKPKDIVSGDFYWGNKKDDYIYVAVADCTGHGVPGAMISMLGVSILSEIAQFEIETDLILNKLRDRIIKELGQGTADKTINDGMDLSLIRYDLKTKEVQISAAFNPVYIIRSKSHPCKEGNLEILAENEEYFVYATQANRQPIGHYFEMTPFDAVTVQLISGDMIFQFSDGYVDQFGGPKNKKFMRKRLLALLLTIHTKPAEQQRDELWQTMEAWMGKNEQVDDISVIGIKI